MRPSVTSRRAISLLREFLGCSIDEPRKGRPEYRVSPHRLRALEVLSSLMGCVDRQYDDVTMNAARRRDRSPSPLEGKIRPEQDTKRIIKTIKSRNHLCRGERDRKMNDDDGGMNKNIISCVQKMERKYCDDALGM
jgi:hypothetical protein